MKNSIISIITSEKTWKNLSGFGFDRKILERRGEFELAFVFNGFDDEGIKYLQKFNPDYFFLRPNLGFDPAAVEHLIKLIPVYNTTLIIHDDHWFEEGDWLGSIGRLRDENPETDVWGNVLIANTEKKYYEFCENNNLGFLKVINPNKAGLLQGLAGIFSARAIKKLKSLTFNFPQTNIKEIAEMGEWAFSSALDYLNLIKKQLPGDIFNFMRHGKFSERDSLIWSANNCLYKNNYSEAAGYYEKYLKFCIDSGYNEGVTIGYMGVANCSYLLNDLQTSIEYCRRALDLFPGLLPAINLLKSIKEKIEAD